MPRIPRKLIVDPTEVGVFHCISRCVRRAFLCGEDPLTGKNFNHRKRWLQERIAFLAGQFGIDLLGFAVMSNHLHLILRNRPDVVARWSDDEVARRWWNLFPLRRDDDGSPAEPHDWELSLVTGNPDRLAEVRERLSSLSWFMRCVAEPVARRANREDDCTGRFWEARYKCQPLLDEAALAACLAYVDLNPVRAGLADSPRTSRFTSVYERLAALDQSADAPAHAEADSAEADSTEADSAEADIAEAVLPATKPAAATIAAASPIRPAAVGPMTAAMSGTGSGTSSDGVSDPATMAGRHPPRAGWLSPFTLSEDAAARSAPPGRASNTGCLPMEFAEYLALLDWTCRQVPPDKREAIPEAPPPILERLHVTAGAWFELMTGFSRLFRRAAGRPDALRRHAAKWGRQRTPGLVQSQALFG